MRRLIIALGFLLTALPARADQIDYFCLFTNAAAAQADSAVGTYWDATDGVWDSSRTFPGIKVVTPQAVVNGISSLTGFWILVSNSGPVAALDADTACVMKLDRDIAAVGGSFVLSAAITGSNRTGLTFQPGPQGQKYPRPLGQ